MRRWHYPLDPNCPEHIEYRDLLLNDPMTHAMGAPVGEFLEDFARRHRPECDQCLEYGTANVEVI